MPRTWNTSGLILEGICGSGKSTLLDRLQAELVRNRSFPSSIVLSEHHTQRVLEKQEALTGLTTKDNLDLLCEHLSYIETREQRLDQMDWLQNGRTNMRLPYLLERFHFTHVCHYDHLDWKDVEHIDQQLADLNCKVCVLTIDEATIHRRVIADRSPEWRQYLKRFGDSDNAIVSHYLEQQNQFLDLCQRSRLETLIVDTSAESETETVSHVAAFWGITEPLSQNKEL